jgi:hypothetical protein
LAEESQQAVLRVLSGSGVVQAGRRCAGQSEGIVEFTVGEESGVTGDGRAVELQLELAVEIDAQGVIVAGRVGAERGAFRPVSRLPLRTGLATLTAPGSPRSGIARPALLPGPYPVSFRPS